MMSKSVKRSKKLICCPFCGMSLDPKDYTYCPRVKSHCNAAMLDEDGKFVKCSVGHDHTDKRPCGGHDAGI